MSKIRHRQLELPVLSNVIGKAGESSGKMTTVPSTQSVSVADGFPKPASTEDQSIYKSISDSYFGAAAKQA